MALLIWMVAGVGIYAAGVALWSRARSQRRARGEKIAKTLQRSGIELTFDEGTSTFGGTAFGHDLVYRTVFRGDAESGEHWTEVDIRVPLGLLILSIRPSHFLSSTIDRPAAPLDLGNDAFTREYVVEGAPRDIARGVLDAGARAWLLARAPATLYTTSTGLRLEARGRFDEYAGEIESLIRGLAHVANRVAPATAAALEAPAASPAEADAPSYRASPRATEIERTLARHRTERAALETRWTTQGRRITLMAWGAAATVFAGVLGLVLRECGHP